MPGVAEQECPPLAESVGDAMVDAVRGEPMDLLNLDAHPLDHALTHIVPRQVVVPLRRIGAHRTNETRPPLVFERKDEEKIGRVEGAVQFAVHHGAAGVDIGDVNRWL